MASTFVHRLFPNTKRIDFFSNLQNNVSTLIYGAMLMTTAMWAVHDYRDWLHYGTGGTPPTIGGWLKMNKLRVVLAFNYLCGDDLRDPSTLPRMGPQYLKSLTVRPGGHPSLRPRTLPQRQFSETIEPRAREVLIGLMKHLHSQYSDILRLSLSNAEGGAADAIYAHPESPACNPEAQKVGFEIAHTHPEDNSLHMLLSPADARAVLEAGWGRRFADPSSVPPGWIMVYAPRDLEEVNLVRRMVEAAIRWTTGADI
ncbi:hypothetical protein N7522_013410 [Penicillium canescens]|nr:hypothetical protein N7522_013410 [Penicillium canescens]